MIKIGQLGLGHNHGEMKMRAVRKFPELFEVVGYAEENEDWVKSRGGLPGYQGLKRMSVDELLAETDAVLVECEMQDLTHYAGLCIEAGKHIHMDKPASGTLEEYKAVLDMAKAKGLVVQLGYMYRYNPGIKRCIEAVKKGELGEIYSINAEMSLFCTPEYKRWMTKYKGGIMYILGSHMVDLIVYLLGEPRKITSFMKHTGMDGVDFPDNNLAVLEYDKALARVYESAVEVNGWGRRQFMVAGSKGTMNIMPMESPLLMTYARREEENGVCTYRNSYDDVKEDIMLPDVPKDGRYDEMMSDFYEYIVGTKTNPFSYEHDYLVQKVLYEIIGSKE